MQKPCEQTEEQRNVKLPLKASGSKKSATHHDPFISNPPTFIFPSTKEKPEGYSKLRWFFETLVHHPLSLLALWIKSLSCASTPCLLLACHAASSTSLDSVTMVSRTVNLFQRFSIYFPSDPTEESLFTAVITL